MPVSDPKLREQLALAGLNPDEHDDPVPDNSNGVVKPEQSSWYDKALLSLPEGALEGSGISLLSRLVSPAFHKGVQDTIHSSAESLTTPKNLAIAGAAMIPPIAPIAAAAFGLMGGKQVIDSLGPIKDTIDSGDQEALGRNLVNAGMGGMMGIGGALHLKGEPKVDLVKELPKETEPKEVEPITDESRLLMAPRVRMPEFQDDTLGINRNIKSLPAPGESEGSINLPESPLGPRTAGYRIKLPPEGNKPIVDVESEPVSTEDSSALKKLVELDKQKEDADKGTPYQPPIVNTDLRQLQNVMKKNTVSKLESWADGVIKDKTSGASANPYLDPEFLSAALVKGTMLVKKGVVAFHDWSKPMIQQFGNDIIPHLARLYRDAHSAIKDIIPEKAELPFTYKGKQEAPPIGSDNFVHQFDLTKDIDGHVAGSTLTEAVLRKKGYDPSELILKDTKVESPKVEDSAPPIIKNNEPPKIDDYVPPVDPSPKEHFIPVIRPETSHLNRIAPDVEAAFKNTYDDQRNFRGQFANKFAVELKDAVGLNNPLHNIKNPLEYLKQNNPDMKAVMDYKRDIEDGIAPKPLSPIQQKISDTVTRVNTDVRNYQIKNKVGREVTTVNPDYLPSNVKPEIWDTLNKDPNSPESVKLKKDFIDDYSSRVTKKSSTTNPLAAKNLAEAKLAEILDGSKIGFVNAGSHFGPIDQAHGIPFPRSWQSDNLLETQAKYLERAAKRFAYNKNIEKPSGMQDRVNQYLNNPHVKTVHDDLIGRSVSDPIRIATDIMGIVKAGIMGPKTAINNLAQSILIGTQHMGPWQTLKNTSKSLATMPRNLAEGYLSGRVRPNMNALELDNNLSDTMSVIHRIRDIVTDVDGRNWGEKLGRILSIGQARFTTADYLDQLNKGKLSGQGQRWFKTFGRDTNWKSGNLTPEEINKISGRFVDSAHGTYDYDSLPKFAQEGGLSPLFSLSRWSIDKSNNFMKYSVNPLIQGNPVPFLMSTLGIVIGGTALEKLKEYLTGRKNNVSNWKEIGAAKAMGMDVKMPIFYKATGLNSAAGHTGFVGDLLNNGMDLIYGKTRPQTLQNPIASTVANIATTWANVASTILHEGYSHDVILQGVANTLENNFQLYRVIDDHLNPQKEKEIDKSNKERDLRVFDTMAGNDITDRTSPFKEDLKRLDLKDYSKETDLNKAIKEELPKLISKAFENAKGDPDKLDKELGKIKGDNYPTMPNMDSEMGDFRKYYEFLIKTQGKEEADKRVKDYMNHQIVSEIKSP